MPRVRVLFEKTGFASFISHIDLPVIFARAARRAGIELEMTQGFSPHARLALALPLPVGVMGLHEPADFWIFSRLSWDDGALSRWNAALPAGIRFVACEEVDGPSLSKVCKAASYDISLTDEAADIAPVAEELRRAAEGAGVLLDIATPNGRILLTTTAVESFGPNQMVKRLTESGVVSGWRDLSITRRCIGGWDEERREVVSLISITSLASPLKEGDKNVSR